MRGQVYISKWKRLSRQVFGFEYLTHVASEKGTYSMFSNLDSMLEWSLITNLVLWPWKPQVDTDHFGKRKKMSGIPGQTWSFGLSSSWDVQSKSQRPANTVKILGASQLGSAACPRFQGPSPPHPLGLAGIFFGFPVVEINLLTFLPLFFPYSFSPCRRKARSPSGCASGPLGPFCCLVSTLLSKHCVYVCMIWTSELWLMQIVCFSRKKFVCMLHAVCVPANIPTAV